MKKLLLILLASSLLLASCGKNNDNNNETGDDMTNDTTMNDTLGDEDGNGTVEDETGDSVLDEVLPDDGMGDDIVEGPTAVTSVTTAEDAAMFIDANVYSQCMDQLPMATMSMPLPLEDMEMVTYHTGLTDLTGITDIILSESMIGSFAYSLVMVRTDGTNTDAVMTALSEQINPAKWVCVRADQIRCVRLDNDIVLVMSDNGRTEPVMNAVIAAAEGVYSNVGTVVNVLG